MEAFLSIPWGTIGPWGIVAFICGCIIRGDLVAKSTMQGRIDDRDVIIRELRESGATRERKLDVVLEQNTLLLRGAETTRHVVESLPRPLEVEGT